MKIEFSVMVEAPIEEVYAFHMDSHNLDEILPPWLDITPISVPLEMKVGAEIHYKVKRFGISMPFIIRINRLDRPRLFSAQVIHSPLHNFAHAHYFKAIDDTTTVITDVIYFPLPFRPFSLIFWPFIKRDMKRIFEYRHRITKQILKEYSSRI